MFPSGGAGDGSVREGLRMRFAESNHPVTGAAQGRVHAEHDLMGVDDTLPPRFGGGRGFATGTAEAVLHLLELLEADTHKLIMPKEVRLQKDKGG